MNLKISQLTAGNPAQAGDIVPIDRAGANYGITAGSIAALAGSGKVQTVRSSPIAALTIAMQGPYSIDFPTPFADGNYTVEATAVCAEALGTLAYTANVVVGLIQPQVVPGNGVIVYISNGDSITHSVTVHITATHD